MEASQYKLEVSIAGTQTLFHILETTLQLMTLMEYRRLLLAITGESSVTCTVLLAIILFLQLFCNTISAILVKRTMKFSQEKKYSLCICAWLHFIPLGHVWRFFKFVFTKDPDDVLEFVVLRILHTTIQTGCFVFSLAYLWTDVDAKSTLSIFTLIISLVSLSFSYASYDVIYKQRQQTDQSAFTDCNDNKVYNNKSAFVECCLTMLSKALLISSRCIALFLFTLTLRTWIILVISCHCIVFSLSVYIIRSQTKEFIGMNFKDIVKNLIHVFDFIQIYPSVSKMEIIAFYIVSGIEIIFSLSVWYAISAVLPNQRNFLLVLTIAFWILGLMCLLLHKAYLSSYCFLKNTRNGCPAFPRHSVTSLKQVTPERSFSGKYDTPRAGRELWNENDQATQISVIGKLHDYTQDVDNSSRQRTVSETVHLNTGLHIAPQNAPSYSYGNSAERDDSPIAGNSHITTLDSYDRNPCAVNLCINQKESGIDPSAFSRDKNTSLSSGEWTSGIAQSEGVASLENDPAGITSEQLSSTSVEFIELDIDPVYFMGYKGIDDINLPIPLLPSKPKRLVKKRTQQRHGVATTKRTVKNNNAVLRNRVKALRRHGSCYSTFSETTISCGNPRGTAFIKKTQQKSFPSDTCSLTFCDECDHRTYSESSTSSCSDSFTMTWPPAKCIPTQCGHNLPSEKIKPMDNVAAWLDTVSSAKGEFEIDPSSTEACLNCSQSNKRCTHGKTRIYNGSNKYVKKSMYNFHRFGSPLPWTQHNHLPQRIAKEVTKAHLWHKLCRVTHAKPKSMFPYNVNGSYGLHLQDC